MAYEESGWIAESENTTKAVFGNIDTSGVLLSTLWSQKGICPMGGNTTICYNEHTPYDPTVTAEPATAPLYACGVILRSKYSAASAGAGV